jgi:hypothetical protein
MFELDAEGGTLLAWQPCTADEDTQNIPILNVFLGPVLLPVERR